MPKPQRLRNHRACCCSRFQPKFHPRRADGTHFDTLAEGSYHATATGRSGCGGVAATDFKVTPKTSTAEVKGAPALTIDKPPKAGNAYMLSKDGNIWFKVSVPSSFSDASAGCCEVEYDYVNAYGGWEVTSSSPVSDSAFNPLTNGDVAIAKGVNYFKVPGESPTRWRMRVRGYKYKTAFTWSEWVEFSVDQK